MKRNLLALSAVLALTAASTAAALTGCGGSEPPSDAGPDARPDSPSDARADTRLDAGHHDARDAGPDATDGGPDAADGEGGLDGAACDAACAKLESCADASLCALECSDVQGIWSAGCILDASCAAVGTLGGLNPDPSLYQCMVLDAPDQAPGSDGLCFYCGISACETARTACASDPACATWLACFNECTGGGSDCYRSCDSMYPDAGTAVSAVYACLCQNCTSPDSGPYATCLPEVNPCGGDL